MDEEGRVANSPFKWRFRFVVIQKFCYHGNVTYRLLFSIWLPFTVSSSLVRVQTPPPPKKLGERASLNGLQVPLTLPTKSNYAWIHLKMPNSNFLFMTLIFPVDCEYSRLSSLLITARDVSLAIFQSRRGKKTVFAGYFLASVEALVSNLTFNWLFFLV